MKWNHIKDKLPRDNQKVGVFYQGNIDGSQGDILTMHYSISGGFWTDSFDSKPLNTFHIYYWCDYLELLQSLRVIPWRETLRDGKTKE